MSKLYFTCMCSSGSLLDNVIVHVRVILQTLIIPPSMRETVNLGTITIRAKPFQDKEVSLIIMYEQFNLLVSKKSGIHKACWWL